jgi:molybdopterin converting factor subunit 1
MSRFVADELPRAINTNHIKVLLFATLRDYVGARTVEIDIPIGMTVNGLTELLVKTYPRLGKAKDSILAAINHEYAADELIIPEDAEIALFPPVSGG